MAGAFGRAARLLSAVATAQGRPTRPEDLATTTPLASLFPTEADRQAWIAAAQDSLKIGSEGFRLRLSTAATVRDVVLLVRAAPER